MHNFLGTCLVLGLLVGGFALTGDLGHLAARGLRVIQATDVPDDEAPVPVAECDAREAARLPVSAAAARVPRTGPDAVAIAELAAGSRVVVWLCDAGRSPAAPPHGLVVDVVDPAAGEALVSEAVMPVGEEHHGGALSAPRRVLIRGEGAGSVIARGSPLHLEPRGIAGSGSRETVGSVVAIEVIR